MEVQGATLQKETPSKHGVKLRKRLLIHGIVLICWAAFLLVITNIGNPIPSEYKEEVSYLICYPYLLTYGAFIIRGIQYVRFSYTYIRGKGEAQPNKLLFKAVCWVGYGVLPVVVVAPMVFLLLLIHG